MEKERDTEGLSSLKEQFSEILKNEKARTLLNALVLASAIKKEGVDMMTFVCNSKLKGLFVKDLRLLLLCAVEVDVCQKLDEVRENLINTAPFRMLSKETNQKIFDAYGTVCERIQEKQISFSDYFENIKQYPDTDVLAYMLGDRIEEEQDLADGEFFHSLKDLKSLRETFEREGQ